MWLFGKRKWQKGDGFMEKNEKKPRVAIVRY